MIQQNRKTKPGQRQLTMSKNFSEKNNSLLSSLALPRPRASWGKLAIGTLCLAFSAANSDAVETGVKGLSLEGSYTHETTSVLDGGINQRTSNRELLTIDANLDLEALMGIQGGRVFAQFLHATAERGGSLDTGDIQAYTNLEVERSQDELYECWYEQTFGDDKFRLKVGKVDANTEFNYVDAAGGFANSSAGFSPTIFAFPTYPNPAMSINLFWNITDTTTLGYGFYDGANAVDGVETGQFGPASFFNSDESNDYFHVFQIEHRWDSKWSLGAGRATAGLWHHTGEFSTFSGEEKNGTTGFFLTVEQQLSGNSEEQGYFSFGQYGWADQKVSDIAQHLAAGIVARSTSLTRDGDEMGLYITHVDLSDATGADFVKNETAIDFYYHLNLHEHFSLQPEIQYIINPSGRTDIDDALVVGIRANLSF